MTNISEAGWIGIGAAALALVVGTSILFKSNKSELSTNNEWIDNSVNNKSVLSQFPSIEGGRKKTHKYKKNMRNKSKKRH